ncbi:MAG: insulinase family protein [Heyndrickxia oleronia]|jgi:predicted Zn-dependent peptidase|uniref:M16 family metallopeptidase n=1 Tax=Heyndrickxia oleronia TaxID=38875 RepID=UPI00242B816A|nr:pitrilysin family protein [Heyndrickxia oleronia]MCI1593497.1 insulinase family protein [Heyndrickxia oleronia]
MNLNKLNNGIKIISERNEYVQSINVGMFIRSGSVFEIKDNNGVSHFIEHLYFRTKIDKKSYAEILSELGVKFGAFTGKEYTCFYFRFTNMNYKLIIKTIKDMLKNFDQINESSFTVEKNVIKSELEMYLNNKQEMNTKRAMELSFPDQSISFEILGTLESLDYLTLDKIKQYYKEFYKPEHIILSVVGDINQEIKDYFEKTFSEIETMDQLDSKEIDYPKFHYTGGYGITKSESDQLIIDINFHTNYLTERDNYSVYLLNSILGYGSKMSRLNREFKENLGIAYSIYSYPTRIKNNYLLSIHAEINKMSLKEFFIRLRNVIVNLQNTYVTDEELKHAMSNYYTSLVFGLEAPMDKMFYYGKSSILNHKIYSIIESYNIMKSVSKAEIKSMASSFFVSKPTLAITGNLDSKELNYYLNS